MNDRIEPRRVFVATFGCQMNEYDSDRLLRLLSDNNFVPTENVEQADFIFLNTCSIREKAVQKVYSYLGRLRPLKEANPDLILGVGGCVAQQEGKALLKQAPYLDIVLGTHGIHRLPEMIEEMDRGRRRICYVNFDYNLDPPPKLISQKRRLKAFLTIMQGCNNFCAYCVVPYVRGREISRNPDEVLAEARDLLAHGVKEITLLGQNVNSYGRGMELNITFTDLIERVAVLAGLERLRFTTSHPKDLSPELIRAIAEVQPLCEHVHLPVQSGSTRILEAMGRIYTRNDYLKLVDALREACPDVALTTDVIVGFPGETEEDFRETMDLVTRLCFDGMYSFKYSDRPKTKASRMSGKVDEETKRRRLAELQDAQREITLERNRMLIGREVEVLVEDRSGRYPGQLTGRTRSHKVVNFDGPDQMIGALVRPRITEAWANSLLGTISPSSADSDLPD